MTDWLEGEAFTIDRTTAQFLHRLDGRTDPYQIDPSLSDSEVDWTLDELDDCDLIRDSRVYIKSFGTFLYTLWIPKWTALLSVAAFLFNAVLMLSWLPVLIAGIWKYESSLVFVDTDKFLWYGLLGLFLGLVLHEIAHACAAISFGGKAFEFGVGVQFFFPVAYTLISRQECSRMQRVQINAAGVEMNFLLAGVFFWLCAAVPQSGSICYPMAICNVVLGAFNLLCLNGLDGMAILFDLIGLDFDTAWEDIRQVVQSRRTREQLRKKGLRGHAIILCCCILFCYQIWYPLLILLDILEVILWIF